MLICDRGRQHCQLLLQVTLSAGLTHHPVSLSPKDKAAGDIDMSSLGKILMFSLSCWLTHLQLQFTSGLGCAFLKSSLHKKDD
jgi:hypothetical protein